MAENEPSSSHAWSKTSKSTQKITVPKKSSQKPSIPPKPTSFLMKQKRQPKPLTQKNKNAEYLKLDQKQPEQESKQQISKCSSRSNEGVHQLSSDSEISIKRLPPKPPPKPKLGLTISAIKGGTNPKTEETTRDKREDCHLELVQRNIKNSLLSQLSDNVRNYTLSQTDSKTDCILETRSPSPLSPKPTAQLTIVNLEQDNVDTLPMDSTRSALGNQEDDTSEPSQLDIIALSDIYLYISNENSDSLATPPSDCSSETKLSLLKETGIDGQRQEHRRKQRESVHVHVVQRNIAENRPPITLLTGSDANSVIQMSSQPVPTNPDKRTVTLISNNQDKYELQTGRTSKQRDIIHPQVVQQKVAEETPPNAFLNPINVNTVLQTDSLPDCTSEVMSQPPVPPKPDKRAVALISSHQDKPELQTEKKREQRDSFVPLVVQQNRVEEISSISLPNPMDNNTAVHTDSISGCAPEVMSRPPVPPKPTKQIVAHLSYHHVKTKLQTGETRGSLNSQVVQKKVAEETPPIAFLNPMDYNTVVQTYSIPGCAHVVMAPLPMPAKSTKRTVTFLSNHQDKTALQTDKTTEQRDSLLPQVVQQQVVEETPPIELLNPIVNSTVVQTDSLTDCAQPPVSSKPDKPTVALISNYQDKPELQTDRTRPQPDGAISLSCRTPWSKTLDMEEFKKKLHKNGEPMWEAVSNSPANNNEELDVEKGDIFKEADNYRGHGTCWKMENYQGKIGYVPTSVLKLHQFKPFSLNAKTRIKREKINLNTINTLISDAGGYFAKQFLMQMVLQRFSTLGAFLETADENMKFRKNVLFKKYLKLLFPPDEDQTNIDQWGLNLVITVLCKCCTLSETAKGIIDKLSSAKDFYIGRYPKAKMEDEEFQTAWNFLYELLQKASTLLEDVHCQNKLNEKMKNIKLSRAEEMGSIENVSDTIKYFHNKQLGHGSSSVVYEGRYGINNCFPVAVKRIHCNSAEEATETGMTIEQIDREIRTHEETEPARHGNIIGYYGFHINLDTLYIALELCNGTLNDYVKNKLWIASFLPVHVNKNLVDGLYFLHSKNIVHRDLKPANIFIVLYDKTTVKKVVLGDFGTAKSTPGTLCSMTGVRGTQGYIAPESWNALLLLEGDASIQDCLSKRSDIFSLGLLFFFTATLGSHPFGNKSNCAACQLNIGLGKQPQLDQLEPQYFSLRVLLSNLLSIKPEDRRNAEYVCSHPALWTHRQILEYLSDISDTFENKVIKNDQAKATLLEDPNLITGGDWMARLVQIRKNDLHKYLKKYKLPKKTCPLYDGKERSVRYLLRAIRNTNHHYQTFPEDTQRDLGEYPRGHVETWLTLCPKLLIHIYNKLGKQTT